MRPSRITRPSQTDFLEGRVMGCCSECDQGKECRSGAPPNADGVLLPDSEPVRITDLPLSPPEFPDIGGVAFLLISDEIQKVAWRLAVLQNQVTSSEAYELGECNEVRVGIVVLNRGAGSVDASLQGSTDKANWSTISTVTLNTLGPFKLIASGVTFRFVRLRYVGNNNASLRLVASATIVGSRLAP